jgi:hypothetical protein
MQEFICKICEQGVINVIQAELGNKILMSRIGSPSAPFAKTPFQHYLVADGLPWHGLMARMGNSLANRPVLPARRPGPDFQMGDFVRIQRNMVVGNNRVPAGAVGLVTAVHDNPVLVGVTFPENPPVMMSIARYELRPAAALMA